ncbi:MAG: hypothetical protein AVDCRST_MAG03-2025 [uncultured Rubrobacteraceae bacterium]|uniref:Uncharacterized protein n=1 Tax=uncultured Rubrobacteraceae bacterium TaxID=349277 RepID=A0A6J4PH53_9ACTN|nr:MAG: hypothetical protein AVDCRST_MAG03-2025 [uncultured Rubrobacteraceae bacterium]
MAERLVDQYGADELGGAIEHLDEIRRPTEQDIEHIKESRRTQQPD